MASTGGGKIRSKRSKVASKPYARRTSFLGRVSDTVKDFITPSWLSNMWQGGEPGDGEQQQQPGGDDGAPATSNAIPQYTFATPHTRPILEEDEPEQEEEEHSDTPEPATQDELATIEEDMIMEEQQHHQQPSTSTGRGGGHKTPFNRYTKPLGASTPNDDDIQIIAEKKAPDDTASDTSVSTSGCSSLMPHLDRADHREKLSQFNLDRLSEMGRQRSGSPRFRSDSPRHRSDSPRNTSLWSETSRSSAFGASTAPSRPQQPSHSSRRPTFNSSYFCTPRGGNSSFGNTSITTTDSPGGRSSSFTSPFYPGKTTFGGSSAQRRAKRPRTSPYEVHLPVKRHVKIRPNSRNETDVTSQTAKRILETLEKMSTPLSDAKKIPLSPTSSPFSFTPGRASRLRQSGTPRAPGLQERGVRIPGPPTTGLRIPQVASIAQNRQPSLPLHKREPKRETAKPETVSKPPPKESIASSNVPSSAGFSFGPSTSTTAPARTGGEGRIAPSMSEPIKSGGKMRSSKREQHYKSPTREDDMFEAPDLPNVSLHLANGNSLPNFDFKFGGSSSSTSGSSLPAKPLMSSTPAPFSSVGSAAAGGFTFATPINKEPSESSKPVSAPDQSLFKFSAPKQATEPKTTTNPASNFSSSPKVSFNPVTKSSSSPMAEQMEDDEIQVVEDDEEEETGGGGGIKVAKQLKKGSCLDVFAMLSKPSKESTDAKAPSESTTKPLSLANKFKKAPGSWTCDECMVNNKPEADKCACCATAKPGATATTAKPPSSTSLFGKQSSIAKPMGNSDTKSSSIKLPVTNSGFGDKFKPAAGSWECDTCMLKNKAETAKCAACETPKPGAAAPAPVNSIRAAPAAAAAPKLGFGDKFKPAAGSWTCDTCMLSNKGTVSKCMACETPKPGSQQTLSAPPASAYKFGPSSTGGGSDSAQTTLGSLPTSGFKFGGQSATDTKDAAPALKPFAFGQTTADDSAKSSSAGSKPGLGGFKMANMPAGGFAFGASKTNDESSAPPPNADPFKSGAFSAPETTKPTVNFATVDSEPKVPSAPTKPVYLFGASSAKTDNANAPVVNFGGSSSTEQKSTFNFGGPKTDSVVNQTSTTNASFKFGGSEQKETSSSSTFKFGGTDSSTAAASKPPPPAYQEPKATSTEQSASKPLFNFKSANSSTSFQFGASSNSTVDPKPAVTESKPAAAPTFNFGAGSTAQASESNKQSTFNFGGTTAKPAENKDAGSTNSVSKAGGFVFGANNPEAAAAAKSTPNASNTTPAASVTPYQFGADNQQQNSGTFMFGGGAPAPAASTTSQPTAPSTGGFTFNATAPASTTSQPAAPSTGGFTFNATAPATTQQAAPAFGATNTTTNSVFGGFGSNASSANPSPVFGNSAPTTTATSVPNFGTTAATPFGTQNQQQQGAVAPAFGAANSSTPFGGTPAPAFGSGATPAFGATNPAPAFGGTNNSTASPFGNSNATQLNTAFPSNAAAQPFQFGASNAQPTQQNNSGVFKFGGSQNNNASSQNAQVATAPGYNFSAQPPASGYNFNTVQAASTPSAGGSPFQFNATSGQASNPFSPTPSSSSTHSGRKIKRAVRRNQRK